MSVPTRFVFHQRAGLSGLGRIALATATAPIRRYFGESVELSTSEEFTARTGPPSPDLVRLYIEHVGGDPDDYPDSVPPHLFPQWTFDLLARTLEHLTVPLHEVVNGGCKMVVNDSIPRGAELVSTARLVEVRELERRIRLHHVIETGPPERPDAVVAHMYNVLVTGRSSSSGDDEDSEDDGGGRPRVSDSAAELERWELPVEAGSDFAKLTGDFNPIHWLAPAARAAGFSNTILHGFSTMARSYEGLRQRWLEPSERIETLDVRFTKPLVLPANVGLYADESAADAEAPESGRSAEVAVGDAPGEAAYMIGDVATLLHDEVRDR